MMNSPATNRFDVIGLGCVAVDDLLYVPSYPPADGKVRVERTTRRFGGLTGAALVTAARMGAHCAYAGCLGMDEFSQSVAANFFGEGVDVSHAPRLPEAKVIHATVVVGNDAGSRNIFYEADGLVGAHPALPADGIIRGAKVLFLDHYGMEGNLRAARVAREAGVAVVADFEDETVPLFEGVLKLVDHLILSEELALRMTHRSSAADAAHVLWHRSRAAVIITCGAKGCWSVSEGRREPHHHPAFAVKAVDTTGCGDVFHGAYAAALARGVPFAARVRFAAAAAALKASQPDIPRLAAVADFLRSAAKA
jgi:sulfofructose kinase